MNKAQLLILAGTMLDISALMVPKRNEAAKKDLVYDVGMNTGADSANYLKKGFRVVAVEANPILAAENADKFRKEIEDKRLSIINRAVGMNAGEKIAFYVPEPKDGMSELMAKHFPDFERTGNKIPLINEMASMSKETACNKTTLQCSPQSLLCDCKELLVDTTTCTDLIKEHGAPHYMKVDIEGFDGLCVKDLVNIPCDLLPDYLSWEDQSITWEGYGKAGNSQDFLHLLEPLGYTQIKVVRVPVLTHADDGSGNFGEEAKDYVLGIGWGTVTQAIEQATPNCYYPNGKFEFMCDVHAKLDRSKCRRKGSLPVTES